MSGRLIILPKKSYCPWKPENVERVLRDERLEKERSEKQQQEQAQDIVVRKRKRTRELIDEDSQALRGRNESLPAAGHINLFQQEEDEYLKGITTTTQTKKQVGIMPVGLGQSELNARGENLPFYMRTQQELDILSSKEDTRKTILDPMKDFVRHKDKEDAVHSDDSSPLSRQHRKKKHKKSRRRSQMEDKESKDTDRQRRRKSTSSSLEDLRERRREREEIESKRASMLLQNDDHQLDDRRRAYQNQYNPGLSRR
jgi:hypothetical protein